ncbi:MAG: hypothetical protein M3352_01490 [Bacteroidota bacterium]|nr:hypothetical protein [Bacteroidota bacterium]
MKTFFLIGCLVVIVMFTGCAQSLHSMQNGYAFFKKLNPGNVQVDENGNEANRGADTVRFIFIELKGKLSPSIDIVLYRNEIFNASIFPVEQSQVEVGQEKISGENITLKPAMGNTLWRIILTKANKKNSLAASDKIILKGKKNGQPFQWVIHKEVEIQAEITK